MYTLKRWMGLLMAAAGLAGLAGLAGFVSPAWADGMIVSGRDRALAINAWGGAAPGVVLRLHNGCSPRNPDCSWIYRNGMLYSQRTGLLVLAPNPVHGGVVALASTSACGIRTRGCRWTYRDGMFISDSDPQLAIAAWGGARYGSELHLSKDCRSTNPDCTWSRP